MSSRFIRPLLTACLSIAGLAGSSARAADHFLTIGGGGDATHNQISLEKNVLYFQSILKDWGVPKSAQEVYFSCGQSPSRAVQYRPQSDTPKVNRLLAQIMGSPDAIELRYREPQIPSLTGASNRQSLTKWFDTTGSQLVAGDRLFVYFTGHGGNGNPARNTTLTLWNENAMPVREFVGLLDKLPKEVELVLVMVQCHSGGFADVIFKGANSDAGKDKKPPVLDDHLRAGFFATVPERQAAGCTPDIKQENYREYSTYFFEALSGRSRGGAKVDPPDYDQDGKVSLAEAHAYVHLTSDTIDIPVCTSEILLRAYSKARMDGVDDLLTPDSSYKKIKAKATPAQLAVIDGLSKQLEIYGDTRTAGARMVMDRTQKERDKLNGDITKMNQDAMQARNQIAMALKSRWPEIGVQWHPRVQEILAKESDDIVKAIESHPRYAGYKTLSERVNKMQNDSLDLERKWVKCQRLMRVIEDVALAANLPKVAAKEIVERYEQIIASENGTLGKPTAVVGER